MGRSSKGEKLKDEAKDEAGISRGEHEDAANELPINIARSETSGELPSLTPPSSLPAFTGSASRATKEQSKLAQAQQPSMMTSMVAEPDENLFFNRSKVKSDDRGRAEVVLGTEPPDASLPPPPGWSRVPFNNDKYDEKMRAAGEDVTSAPNYPAVAANTTLSSAAARGTTSIPAYEAGSTAAGHQDSTYDAAYGEPVVAVAVEGWVHSGAAAADPEFKEMVHEEESPPTSLSEEYARTRRIMWIVAGAILLLAIILAISLPLAAGRRDTTNDAKTPGGAESCRFVLDLVTDGFGAETSWDLVDQSSFETVASAPEGAYENDKVYRKTVLINDGTYQFAIYDSASAGSGDGIQPPGSYAISLNGEELVSGGSFADSEGTIFKATDCSSVPPSRPIITLPPVAAPTKPPAAAPSEPPVEVPVAAPTIAPVTTPVATPTEPLVPATLPPVPAILPPVPAPTPPPTPSPTLPPATLPPAPAPVKAPTIAPVAAAPVKQPTGGGQPVAYYDNSSEYYYEFQQGRRRRLAVSFPNKARRGQ
jgi:hypothetical protein